MSTAPTAGAGDAPSIPDEGGADGERPGAGPRPRTVVLGGLALVVVLLAGFLAATYWPEPEVQVPSLAGDAFDEDVIRTNSTTAAYSPDGGRIAVLTDEGIGLASGGRVDRITRPGARIVDFAWMPGSDGLLVMEGPVSSGFLTVVDLEGKVAGAVELQPAFDPGTGFGLTVEPGSTRAVSVAVDREVIGGRSTRDLVVIDLQSGAVERLSDPALESAPQFVGDNQVAFVERRDGSSRIALVRLDTGGRVLLSPAGRDAAMVGVLGDGGRVAYTTVGEQGRIQLWAVEVTGGRPTRLDTFPAGHIVVAVDPTGRRALVSEPAPVAEEGEPAGLRTLRDVVLRSAVAR